MRNTFFKLWVHAILQTTGAHAAISEELSPLFHLEIEKRFIEEGCEIAAVGGDKDHVHMLFAQNPLLSLHDTLSFIKGISQRWYQLHDFGSSYYKFQWADGYCAYSVSASNVPKVKAFIENQAEVHLETRLIDEIHHLNILHKVDLRDEEIEKEIRKWAARYTFDHIGGEWMK